MLGQCFSWAVGAFASRTPPRLLASLPPRRSSRWAIPLSMLRIRYARLSLVFIAACCIVGLGGCMPGVIVEGSTMYRTAHTPVRARTVSKARTVSQSRTANLMVHTGTLKPPIPLPDRSLLEPQPSLDCTFKGPLSNPVTVEEMRMKLDYEQQCYRQAESITRDRLQQLQNSLNKPIAAVGTSKSPIPLSDRSLLEPQPSPDCTFKGPLSNPVTAEEMRMKLDYEQQCYRQAESIARDRLLQLQNSVEKTIKTEGRPSQ